jgi:hypothetical protein
MVNSANAFACAYVCPYNDLMVKEVSDRMQLNIRQYVPSGYGLPSLQSVNYLVEISYINKFQEKKLLIFKKKHVHGYGFDLSTIGETEFFQLLNDSSIPPFDNVDSLWNYILSKCTRRLDTSHS